MLVKLRRIKMIYSLIIISSLVAIFCGASLKKKENNNNNKNK
jgi:H+/gluconate symporter-like permease